MNGWLVLAYLTASVGGMVYSCHRLEKAKGTWINEYYLPAAVCGLLWLPILLFTIGAESMKWCDSRTVE